MSSGINQAEIDELFDDPDDYSIRIFLEKGGDPNVRSSRTGNSLLHVAPWPETIELLLKKGADISAVNEIGYTPLQKEIYAVNPWPEKAKIFLQHTPMSQVDRLEKDIEQLEENVNSLQEIINNTWSMRLRQSMEANQLEPKRQILNMLKNKVNLIKAKMVFFSPRAPVNKKEAVKRVFGKNKRMLPASMINIQLEINRNARGEGAFPGKNIANVGRGKYAPARPNEPTYAEPGLARLVASFLNETPKRTGTGAGAGTGARGTRRSNLRKNRRRKTRRVYQ